MSVCVHVCIRMSMRICVCTCVWMCARACACTCVACARVCRSVDVTRVRVCMRSCVCARKFYIQTGNYRTMCRKSTTQNRTLILTNMLCTIDTRCLVLLCTCNHVYMWCVCVVCVHPFVCVGTCVCVHHISSNSCILHIPAFMQSLHTC